MKGIDMIWRERRRESNSVSVIVKPILLTGDADNAVSGMTTKHGVTSAGVTGVKTSSQSWKTKSNGVIS